MVKQIKTFSISRLTVGSTSDFHSKVNELIVKATPSALYIVDQAALYAEACALLASIVNRSTTFVSTSEMKAEDKRRDNLVGVVSNVVRAHKTNPIAAKQAYAIRLDADLAPYKGIGGDEYSKQTAEVKGMLAVLALEANVAAVKALGLEDEVAELAKANTAFETAFLSKAGEASTRLAQTDVSSDQAVGTANELYGQIITIVNAYAIVSTSDVIEKFIDDVNGLVTLYASIAGSSTSGGSGPDSGGGGGGEEERPGEL